MYFAQLENCEDKPVDKIFTVPEVNNKQDQELATLCIWTK